MNEPKRLLAPDGDAATGFERQLLQAVLDERPSEAATQRMLEATLAAGTAAAPGAAGMGAGAWLTSAAVAAGIAGLAAAAWLGGDASPDEVAKAPANAQLSTPPPTRESAGGFADGTQVGRTPEESPTANLDSGNEPVDPTATSGTSLEASREPAVVRSSGASPGAGTATAKASAAKAPEAATRTPASLEREQLSRTLREEVELLDEARSALQAGDASGALATLARYDQRFPSGMLRKEGAVLRQRATALTSASESPER